MIIVAVLLLLFRSWSPSVTEMYSEVIIEVLRMFINYDGGVDIYVFVFFFFYDLESFSHTNLNLSEVSRYLVGSPSRKGVNRMF